jgi:flagellin-like protein
MKGVSTVIATILMLMITIGLAGLAASYFFGIVDTTTDVVLVLEEAECDDFGVTVWVRNDGTDNSGLIDWYVDNEPAGNITSLGSGNTETATNVTWGNLTHLGATGPIDISLGYHNIRISSSRSTARGQVFCTTEG